MKFQSSVYRFPAIPVRHGRDSQTVPDMSFTPREIIAKFSRGERVPLGFKGVYDDESASPFEDDPTRDPEFDFGDYVEEMHALEERQKASSRRSSVKDSSDPKRKASSERVNASDQATRETTSVGAEDPSSGQA